MTYVGIIASKQNANSPMRIGLPALADSQLSLVSLLRNKMHYSTVCYTHKDKQLLLTVTITVMTKNKK